VVELGKGVSRFREGDPVFAFAGIELGCHAEYRVLPAEGRIVPLPPGIGLEEGAALSFGGTTALHYLRTLGRIARGESLLVVGASGAVGSAAVQLAVHVGARVTAVTSGPNAELVRRLGAERVIDYTRESLEPGRERFDVVLDTVGAGTLEGHRRLVPADGRILLVAAGLGELLRGVWLGATSKLRVGGGSAPERREDLVELAQLAEAGAYRPVIDRVLPFERIVDAHALVASGRKRGSVVLRLDGGGANSL
jgi:NADPH:quinone reductase-like Zn-dependent oxidoreductase